MSDDGADWLTLALLLPAWLVRSGRAAIEDACVAWDDATDVWPDEDEEAHPYPCPTCGGNGCGLCGGTGELADWEDRCGRA